MHGGRGCSSKGDSWMHPDATASRWRESERHGIHLGVFGCSSRGESLGGRKRTYQTLVEEQPASSNTSELLTHPVTVVGSGRVHIRRWVYGHARAIRSEPKKRWKGDYRRVLAA
jgi:hypothetical protein